MQAAYDSNAPKRAANLSLNSDLLTKARELDINLSATLESALAEEVRRRQAERWLAANREAIERYNAQIEESGVFGKDFRSF